MTENSTMSIELQAAQDRFHKVQDRTAKNFGFGDTDEAQVISGRCLERLTQAIGDKLENHVYKGDPKVDPDKSIRVLSEFKDYEKIALAALGEALHDAVNEKPFQHTCASVGRAINHEIFAGDLRKHDETLFKRIERGVSLKHGNLKYRLQAARSAAKRGGFNFKGNWNYHDLVGMGSQVLSILLQTLPDVFERVELPSGSFIVVREEAQKLAESAMKQYIQNNPIFLPSLSPPVPWTDFHKGGPVDPVAQRLGTLVRTRHKETVAAVRSAIRSGQMQPTIDAVNAAQATPWAINRDILIIMRECSRRGIAVDGIPSQTNFELPEHEKPWEEMTEVEQRLWRIKTDGIKKANRILLCDRLRFEEDMETASEAANHDRFYTPCNIDWRGRVYPMTQFNFQRGDYVRALFKFADVTEPIGEEGLYWLKVHTANCGDFDKVSKKDFAERVKWVDDNLELIRHCAVKDWDWRGPLHEKSLAFWTQADKPFLFLAACIDLIAAIDCGPDYISGLPLSWDGSCSGLQHLCAMTRAEEGRFVNLTDNASPEDVYLTVAHRALISIVDASNESPVAVPPNATDTEKKIAKAANDHIKHAKAALAYGVTRKVVKRNVMTYSYSSNQFGMAQQHMDDLMEPLELEVLQGKLEEHPFGSEWEDRQGASRFLAKHVHSAIEQIVNKPAQAMTFLQKLAKAMAHEGKPLEWTTPAGLPWSNRYHEAVTRPVRLWLHDKAVNVRIFDGVKKEIDKKRAANGVAPNFVHACDAAHLLLTVLAAAKEGFKHFALVHDSFGCIPSRAARFHQIIREQFVLMYEQHDVLEEVLQRALCDLIDPNVGRMPERIIPGNLNIKEVLNAKYAFA